MNASLIQRENLNLLVNKMVSVLENDGDIIECGVFRGGSAIELLKKTPKNKTLYLVDSFCGIPDATNKYDNKHKNGDFCFTDVGSLQEQLLSISNNFVILKGIIPEVLNKIEDKKFCFVHIDTDTYNSYKNCLNFFWNRVNGIIYMDDYASSSCKGAKLAVDEFMKDKKEQIERIGDHQAVIQRKT